MEILRRKRVKIKNKDLGDSINEALGPDKTDIIYDCEGNDISMGQATTHARKGSTIIFVTVFGKLVNVDWGFPFLLIPF